jgi:hypothetical protein
MRNNIDTDAYVKHGGRVGTNRYAIHFIPPEGASSDSTTVDADFYAFNENGNVVSFKLASGELVFSATFNNILYIKKL